MLRRLVLDVLKPHNPSILDLSNKLSNVKAIDSVNIITIEIDKEVENVKIILQDPEFNLNKVKKIIAEKLGVDLEEVVPEASFVDDLGADSLDLVELIMSMEEEFDTDIPDEEAEKIQTVQDAINFVNAQA